jgi:type IV pilus assembly protein PilV
MSNRPETVVRYAAGSLPLAASSPPSSWGNQWPARPFRHQPALIPCSQGFSLLEVLVAVIVLAVGLLGVAALQVSVLKSNDSSRFRSIASFAITDLIDRVRADPTALLTDLKASIPQGTCGEAEDEGEVEGDEETTPISRWKRDFCALGLPLPAPGATSKPVDGLTRNSDHAMEIDCKTAGGCGVGNCEIIVRWDDSRSDPRNASKSKTPVNTAFRVCTRLPVL